MSYLDLTSETDYFEIKNNFAKELTAASLGEKSSLSFIKNSLPENPLITSGLIQGIVIGGTNYIISTEELLSGGNTKILTRNTGVLPILNDEKAFFAFLDEHIDNRADAIGLNFGFPLIPAIGSHGEIDGKLAYGTKEHVFKGLIGKTLGEEIKSFYKTKFNRDIIISVANDSICLTLSGNGDEDGSIIAGTGFNIGLNIKEQKNLVVNLEAGNFDKFDLSDVLKKIDSESEQPGVHLFEKTVSGKYLSLYFDEKAKNLNLAVPQLTTSQELTKLSHTQRSPAGDLARVILERSAFLVAAAIAGIYEFLNQPEKMTFVGEGSMLWYGWKYPENLQKQLLALGIPEGAVKFKKIEDSSINGAIGLLTS